MIESQLSETQTKLVDSVVANATPRQTQEEMLMAAFLPMFQGNPEWVRKMVEQGARKQKN